MTTATQAKVLHGVATGVILLFALQLVLAIAFEFAPPWFRYGHALYPLFIGRDPISLPNVLINFGLLILAMIAFFYADTLERETFFEENVAKHQRRRDGRTRFSQ